MVATLDDVDKLIAEIETVVTDGFGNLEDTLRTEVNQIMAAINKGADTTATIKRLTNFRNSLSERFGSLKTQISSVIPDTPEEEEEPPPVDPPSTEPTAPVVATPADPPSVEKPTPAGVGMWKRLKPIDTTEEPAVDPKPTK